MLNLKKPKDSRSLAKTMAQIANQKLAREVVVLNMSEIEHTPCDFFVVCTCETDNHIRSTADDMMRASKDFGLGKPRSEGFTAGEWIVIDFFNVVVHLMLEPTRKHYKLENLWGDSKFLEVNENERLVNLDKEKVKSYLAN